MSARPNVQHSNAIARQPAEMAHDTPSDSGPLPEGISVPALNLSLDALIVIDSRGIVHDWNPSAEELFSYTAATARGRPLADLIVPPEHRAAHLQGLQRYLESGASHMLNRTMEVEAMRRDGRRVTVMLTVSRLPGEGEPMFLGAMRDRSRWQSKTEQQEIERRFMALVEQLPVVVFTDAADAHLTPLYVSPQIESLLGYTPEEWLADADMWEKCLHPDDRGYVLQKAINHDYADDFVLEYRLVHRHGSAVWVREETVTIFDDDEQPLYSQGIFIDITERKRDAERARDAEARYRSLVEQTPAITFRSEDPDFATISYASPKLHTILGYEPDAWTSDPDLLWDRIHPDDLPGVRAAYVASIETGKPLNLEYRQGTAVGTYVWISLGAELIVCSDGVPLYWQGIMTDVTERREIEDAYASLRERYRHFADSANDAIIALDLDGNFLFSNPAFERLAGYGDEELKPMTFGMLLEEEARATANSVAERLRRDGSSAPERTVLRLRTRGGEVLIVEASASLIYERDEPIGFQAILRDITARTELEARLAYQAFHDDLTRLPNRAMLLERLREWESHPVVDFSHRALIFLDLDNFKVINDSLGHDVGDQTLIAVGERIRSWLRAEDFIARFGGDEFVVLLSDARGPVPVEDVARRLIRLFEEPFEVAGREIRITASFGIAALSDDVDRPEELLRRADLAMYRGKARGRNRFVFHDQEMDRVALDRLDLESDLRRAIDRDELSVAYQPFIDLSTGRTIGVEALVRWDHPIRGQLSPGEFIPIAEESGLIVELDRWMMRQALSEVCSWPGTLRGSSFHLSVNISARQLDQPDLDAYVGELLASHASSPSVQLVLELTETAMMQDAEQACETLSRLSARGVRMALDDFGMGYSSLAQIRHLPIDYIKIDRQFTAEICERKDDLVIVSGMIELSHALGLSVVAEGVETSAQARLLADLNCDFGQGYYYGCPAPSRNLVAMLDGERIVPDVKSARCVEAELPLELPVEIAATGD